MTASMPEPTPVSLLQLPAELLLEIFAHSSNFHNASLLSQTNRRLNELWKGNLPVICLRIGRRTFAGFDEALLAVRVTAYSKQVMEQRAEALRNLEISEDEQQDDQDEGPVNEEETRESNVEASTPTDEANNQPSLQTFPHLPHLSASYLPPSVSEITSIYALHHLSHCLLLLAQQHSRHISSFASHLPDQASYLPSSRSIYHLRLFTSLYKMFTIGAYLAPGYLEPFQQPTKLSTDLREMKDFSWISFIDDNGNICWANYKLGKEHVDYLLKFPLWRFLARQYWSPIEKQQWGIGKANIDERTGETIGSTEAEGFKAMKSLSEGVFVEGMGELLMAEDWDRLLGENYSADEEGRVLATWELLKLVAAHEILRPMFCGRVGGLDRTWAVPEFEEQRRGYGGPDFGKEVEGILKEDGKTIVDGWVKCPIVLFGHFQPDDFFVPAKAEDILTKGLRICYESVIPRPDTADEWSPDLFQALTIDETGWGRGDYHSISHPKSFQPLLNIRDKMFQFAWINAPDGDMLVPNDEFSGEEFSFFEYVAKSVADKAFHPSAGRVMEGMTWSRKRMSVYNTVMRRGDLFWHFETVLDRYLPELQILVDLDPSDELVDEVDEDGRFMASGKWDETAFYKELMAKEIKEAEEMSLLMS